MNCRSISCIAVLISAYLSHAAPGLAGQAACEIPFRCYGHLIVVEASAGNKDGLRFLIDTGATGTVVDNKLIKALAMKRLAGDSRIVALGGISKANQFHLPRLQIGPVYTMLQLHCSEADLSDLGVDGIIGADLLGQQTWLASRETNEVIESGSFTIDFESRTLRFGVQEQLNHTVPMEERNPQVIVVALIQGHPLRLAVDTGAHTIFLYKESQMGWIKPMVTHESAWFYMAGGMSAGKRIQLPDMELGNSQWRDLNGILMDLPNQSKDGLLSVWQLGLKIVHFDFERKLMSWNK
jgi:predicted aspartyl protease